MKLAFCLNCTTYAQVYNNGFLNALKQLKQIEQTCGQQILQYDLNIYILELCLIIKKKVIKIMFAKNQIFIIYQIYHRSIFFLKFQFVIKSQFRQEESSQTLGPQEQLLIVALMKKEDLGSRRSLCTRCKSLVRTHEIIDNFHILKSSNNPHSIIQTIRIQQSQSISHLS
ncbi:hypothetical protein pb186bvf_016234 [Paramecium bursaria]